MTTAQNGNGNPYGFYQYFPAEVENGQITASGNGDVLSGTSQGPGVYVDDQNAWDPVIEWRAPQECYVDVSYTLIGQDTPQDSMNWHLGSYVGGTWTYLGTPTTLVTRANTTSNPVVLSATNVHLYAGDSIFLIADCYDNDAERRDRRQGGITFRPVQRTYVVATTPNASEVGPVSGVYTVYRDEPSSGAVTVNYAMSGTAASGDYQTLSGSVLIPNGQASATVTLTPIDDNLLEGAETATLNLAAGTGYSLAISPNQATVTIADDLASPAPSGLGATAVSATQINLNWTNNCGNQTGFYVDQALDAGFTQGLTTYTTTSTSYSDTGLTPGTTYYFRVRAYNASASSTNSIAASAATVVTYYWTGGAGTWSVGGGGWVNASDQAVNWTNSGIAVFDGAAGGAVTISGAVSPAEIEFETNGYSLNRDALHDDSIVLPATGGVIRVDSASATIASPIASGALLKEGSGALVLSGSSGYSGATYVVAGALEVDGALAAGGDVYVENGGALSGKGSVGTVVVEAGGALTPGANGSGGLTTAAVDLLTGCTLNYVLGTGNSSSDGLVVAAAVGMQTGVMIDVSPGAQWGNGMYPLLDLPSTNYASPVVFDTGFTVAGGGGHYYSLVGTGNDIELDVQAVSGVWSASGGGAFTWTRRQLGRRGRAERRGRHGRFRHGGGQWHGDDRAGGGGDVERPEFQPRGGRGLRAQRQREQPLQLANGGSAATISTTGGSDAINAPVVLESNVNVTVASGASLTISGAISQSGGGQGLTFSGGGSLTLSGSNSYSGGTTISGGTLAMTSAGIAQQRPADDRQRRAVGLGGRQRHRGGRWGRVAGRFRRGDDGQRSDDGQRRRGGDDHRVGIERRVNGRRSFCRRRPRRTTLSLPARRQRRWLRRLSCGVGDRGRPRRCACGSCRADGKAVESNGEGDLIRLAPQANPRVELFGGNSARDRFVDRRRLLLAFGVRRGNDYRADAEFVPWPDCHPSQGASPIDAAGWGTSKRSAPARCTKRPFRPRNGRVPGRGVNGGRIQKSWPTWARGAKPHGDSRIAVPFTDCSSSPPWLAAGAVQIVRRATVSSPRPARWDAVGCGPLASVCPSGQV